MKLTSLVRPADIPAIVCLLEALPGQERPRLPGRKPVNGRCFGEAYQTGLGIFDPLHYSLFHTLGIPTKEGESPDFILHGTHGARGAEPENPPRLEDAVHLAEGPLHVQ